MDEEHNGKPLDAARKILETKPYFFRTLTNKEIET